MDLVVLRGAGGRTGVRVAFEGVHNLYDVDNVDDTVRQAIPEIRGRRRWCRRLPLERLDGGDDVVDVDLAVGWRPLARPRVEYPDDVAPQ